MSRGIAGGMPPLLAVFAGMAGLAPAALVRAQGPAALVADTGQNGILGVGTSFAQATEGSAGAVWVKFRTWPDPTVCANGGGYPSSASWQLLKFDPAGGEIATWSVDETCHFVPGAIAPVGKRAAFLRNVDYAGTVIEARGTGEGGATTLLATFNTEEPPRIDSYGSHAWIVGRPAGSRPRVLRARPDPWVVQNGPWLPDPPMPVLAAHSLAAAKGRVYFVWGDAASGMELWVSNGTQTGTGPVADVAPGPVSSHPRDVSVAGGLAWWSADDGVHGRELWRSDGTSDGTWLVADALAGPGDGVDVPVDGSPRTWWRGGRMFFAARGDSGSDVLWAAEDAPGSAVPLGGLEPITEAARIVDLASTDLLVFATVEAGGVWSLSAVDPENGAGAALVTFDRPPGRLLGLGAVALFSAHDERGYELWRSDGTIEGTHRLTDHWPGAEGSRPRILAAFPEGAVVAAYGPGVGRELHVSDGQSPELVLVADVNPKTPGGAPKNLTPYGSDLLFTASSGVSSETSWSVLWRTDGTTAGTTSLGKVPSADPVWWLKDAQWMGGEAWFLGSSPNVGTEVRRMAVDSGETSLVNDVCPEIFYPYCYGYSTCGSNPCNGGLDLQKSGDLLFANLRTTSCGARLHVLDADGAATLLTPFCGSSNTDDLWKKTVYPSGMTPMASGIIFSAFRPDLGREPWWSDGTPEGTAPVSDLAYGSKGSEPFGFTVVGDAVVFSAWTSGVGRELFTWSPGATKPAVWADLVPGPVSSCPSKPYPWQGDLLVPTTAISCDVSLLPKLYRTDGTAGGTSVVWESGDLAHYGPAAIVAETPGLVWFRLGSAQSPGVVAVTDGTAAGTASAADVLGLDGAVVREAWTIPEGLVLLAVETPETGIEPWRSDGTPEGTWLVEDIRPGPESSAPESVLAHAGRVWFTADDGQHGRELWAVLVSDLETPAVEPIEPDDSTLPPPVLISTCEELPNCDDGVPCTDDVCSEGVCLHLRAAGCCLFVEDCDDGEICTIDSCKEGACEHKALTSCCASDGECGEGDPCSVAWCEPGKTSNLGKCTTVPIPPGEGAFLCDDGDPCTWDACVPVLAACTHDPSGFVPGPATMTSVAANSDISPSGFGQPVVLGGKLAAARVQSYYGGSGGIQTYRRGPAGWEQDALLWPPAAPKGGQFGGSMELSNHRLVAGRSEGYGGPSGAVHVYVHTGESWELESTLLPPDGAGTGFGKSVSLEGDTIVAAESLHDAFGTDAGVTRVYHLGPEGWFEEALLASPNPMPGAAFGLDLRMKAGRIVVLEQVMDDDAAVGVRAHIFGRHGGAWLFEGTLDDEVLSWPPPYGALLAFTGERAALANPTVAVVADSPGVVALFRLEDHDWIPDGVLVPDAGTGSTWFGGALAMEGDTLLVGAPTTTVADEMWAGAVHVFHRNGVGWTRTAVVTAWPPIVAEYFGGSLSLSGATAMTSNKWSFFAYGYGPPTASRVWFLEGAGPACP